MALGPGEEPGQLNCDFTQGHKEMDGDAVLTALQFVITACQLSATQNYHCRIHLTFFRNRTKPTTESQETCLHPRKAMNGIGELSF